MVFSGHLGAATHRVGNHASSLRSFCLRSSRANRTRCCLFTFVLTVVAGFESSTWVGGITFAFAAAIAGLVLLDPHARLRIGGAFILWSAAGAVLALAIAAPFLDRPI